MALRPTGEHLDRLRRRQLLHAGRQAARGVLSLAAGTAPPDPPVVRAVLEALCDLHEEQAAAKLHERGVAGHGVVLFEGRVIARLGSSVRTLAVFGVGDGKQRLHRIA